MLTATENLAELKYCRSETDANHALKDGWTLLDFAVDANAAPRFLFGRYHEQLVDQIGIGQRDMRLILEKVATS